jgi:putative membrane protein
MSDDKDPRVYFAAERTLLAWLRSGIAVMGLGFIVARFGLFLRLLRDPGAKSSHLTGSSVIGVGLLILGAVMIGVAAFQHHRFCRTLPLKDRPRPYSTMFGVGISSLVAILGIALAGYLVWSMQTQG